MATPRRREETRDPRAARALVRDEVTFEHIIAKSHSPYIASLRGNAREVDMLSAQYRFVESAFDPDTFNYVQEFLYADVDTHDENVFTFLFRTIFSNVPAATVSEFTKALEPGKKRHVNGNLAPAVVDAAKAGFSDHFMDAALAQSLPKGEVPNLVDDGFELEVIDPIRAYIRRTEPPNQLYHGTNPESSEKILSGRWNPDFCELGGDLWSGRAIYFSDSNQLHVLHLPLGGFTEQDPIQVWMENAYLARRAQSLRDGSTYAERPSPVATVDQDDFEDLDLVTGPLPIKSIARSAESSVGQSHHIASLDYKRVTQWAFTTRKAAKTLHINGRFMAGSFEHKDHPRLSEMSA
ncbi:hypothetical protein RQP46_003343 [Phenoliferia psychrophenolica]